MKLLIIAVISIVIGVVYVKFNKLTCPLPLPVFDTNRYWGSDEVANYKPDETIKPFKVEVNKEEIIELQQQLNRTFKYTKPLEGINFEYGFNSIALAGIVKYWRDSYLPKWVERENYLNKLPQYTTEIQGLKIHFIHAKPSKETAAQKKVIPLLLLHGWPGSVREFYDFIPILTDANSMSDYAFEVIAPSLVGYGWSDAAAKTGFNAAEMAIVMRNLMLRVGHEKFLVQGGDWGSIIGGLVATIFPDNVYGYHSNMCMLNTPLSTIKQIIASFAPEKFLPSRFFYEHHFPTLEKLAFLIEESGYFHIQATKPDTVGTALANSPIGLAAYILEKFQVSTGVGLNQKSNALDKVFTIDAVLDNVMIYYLSNTIVSSVRFYAENVAKEFRSLHLDRVQSPVSMGCARFKNDLPPALDWQLRDKYPNLIHSKYFNQAGHFAALEVPVMLYIDFAEFVNKINFEK
ncbi:juvenile hormone epoxide hydrolase 1 isoform X2 [Teleopsis dalmanni]|uniref:juvenile hormone epoxide hydrolase 1 isoform X2 n=1 Tax=Teleopsis dalmanni TaxID=139649 RepID=UPI0018CCEAA9|nr:juvenile hormone epoxide hydrolase 1 isoform X2 [Teleopsis dalmanni]